MRMEEYIRDYMRQRVESENSVQSQNSWQLVVSFEIEYIHSIHSKKTFFSLGIWKGKMKSFLEQINTTAPYLFWYGVQIYPTVGNPAKINIKLDPEHMIFRDCRAEIKANLF